MAPWRFPPPPRLPLRTPPPRRPAGSSRTQTTTQPRAERSLDSVRISRGGRALSVVVRKETRAAVGGSRRRRRPQQVLRCNSTLTALDVSENHIPESLSLEVRRRRRRRTGRRFRTTHDLLRGARAHCSLVLLLVVPREACRVVGSSSSQAEALAVLRPTRTARKTPRHDAKQRVGASQAEAIAVRETTRSLSRREEGGTHRAPLVVASQLRSSRGVCPMRTRLVGGGARDAAAVALVAARALHRTLPPPERCKEAVNAGDCFAASSRPPTAVRGPTNGGGGGGASTRRVRGGARASCTIA